MSSCQELSQEDPKTRENYVLRDMAGALLTVTHSTRSPNANGDRRRLLPKSFSCRATTTTGCRRIYSKKQDE